MWRKRWKMPNSVTIQMLKIEDIHYGIVGVAVILWYGSAEMAKVPAAESDRIDDVEILQRWAGLITYRKIGMFFSICLLWSRTEEHYVSLRTAGLSRWMPLSRALANWLLDDRAKALRQEVSRSDPLIEIAALRNDPRNDETTGALFSCRQLTNVGCWYRQPEAPFDVVLITHECTWLLNCDHVAADEAVKISVALLPVFSTTWKAFVNEEDHAVAGIFNGD